MSRIGISTLAKRIAIALILLFVLCVPIALGTALWLNRSPDRTRDAMLGVYTVEINGGVEMVELNSDRYVHRFVDATGGEISQQQGTWELDPNSVSLLLNDFEPLVGKTFGGPVSQRCQPQRFWGNLCLCKNPDTGEGWYQR